MSVKNSNDTMGNRTRDLQPTATVTTIINGKLTNLNIIINIFICLKKFIQFKLYIRLPFKKNSFQVLVLNDGIGLTGQY